MATAHDIASGALRLITSLTPGENIPGGEAENALNVLNEMISAWSAEPFMAPFRTLEQFALAPGQASYTIGPGANMNTVRPDEVTNAYFRSGSLDVPVLPYTKEQYAAIPLKDSGGDPERYFYDAQFPNGVIYLWPVPSRSLTLWLESRKPINQFSSLSASLIMPGAYFEAMKYKLAERLAPEYGAVLSPDAKELCREAFNRVKRMNAKPKAATFDPAFGRNSPTTLLSG